MAATSRSGAASSVEQLHPDAEDDRDDQEESGHEYDETGSEEEAPGQDRVLSPQVKHQSSLVTKERQSPPAKSWDTLPLDLLAHVFSLLSDPRDLRNCMGVCRGWHRAFGQERASSSHSTVDSRDLSSSSTEQPISEEEEALWRRLHRNYFGGPRFEGQTRFDTLTGLCNVVDADGRPLRAATNWKEQFKQDLLILAQMKVLEQALLWATNFGYHQVVKRLLYKNHIKVWVTEEDQNEEDSQVEMDSYSENASTASTTNERRGSGMGTDTNRYQIARSLIDLEYRSPDTSEGEASPTPLLLAVMKGYFETAEVLLAFGADPDAQLLDGSGKCSLHIAIAGMTGQSDEKDSIMLDLLRLLLAKKADTEIRAKHGLTPLIFAASLNNLDAVQVLLTNNADVDAQTDNTELTALHIAVQNKNREMVKSLLDAGALVDARSHRLNTPLHLAAASDVPEIVRLLLAEGSAKVNAINKKLWTPLHFAAAENAVNAVRVLLEYGANVRAETKYKLTPIDFAHDRQHKVVLKLLKKHEKCIVM